MVEGRCQNKVVYGGYQAHPTPTRRPLKLTRGHVMKNRIFFAFLFAIAGSASAASDLSYTHEDVRSQFHSSKNLPDGIAYLEFLRLLQPTDGDDTAAMAIVAEALSIKRAEGDTNSDQLVQARLSQFRQNLRDVKSERASATTELMCGGTPFSSADEVFDSMNLVDDYKELIAEKSLRVELKQLDPYERGALLRYLNELKLSVSYVKIDARSQFREEVKHMGDQEALAFIQHKVETACRSAP